MLRYVIGAFMALGLAIAIIVIILTGGSGKSALQPINLMKLANSSQQVRFVVQGSLTANETRRSIEITIGRDSSELDVIKGYQGQIIATHSIANNQAAYATFLRGLTLAGFNLGNNDPKLADERGHCALGRRYIYEVVGANGNLRQRYWFDSCGVGTFKGDSGLVQSLFESQIPDYGDLTSDVDLSS